MRGCGWNPALLVVKVEPPMCGVAEITPSVNVYVAARPCASFQPVEDSPRKPSDTVSFGDSRITSCAYSAANSDRQFISVGAGSNKKLEVFPARKVVRLANVAWPNWLSASVSFDWNCWNHTPKLNWWRPRVQVTLSSYV